MVDFKPKAIRESQLERRQVNLWADLSQSPFFLSFQEFHSLIFASSGWTSCPCSCEVRESETRQTAAAFEWTRNNFVDLSFKEDSKPWQETKKNVSDRQNLLNITKLNSKRQLTILIVIASHIQLHVQAWWIEIFRWGVKCLLIEFYSRANA